MGGGKGDAPPPIDPGKAMGEYLFGRDFRSFGGVTDPRLQERLIAAEEQFRPRYAALELADIGTFARGIEAKEAGEGYEAQLTKVSDLEAQLSATPKTITVRGGVRGMGRKSVANPEYVELQKQLSAEKSTLSELAPITETPGLFDLLEESGRRAGEIQRESLAEQRAADVAALQEFSPQIVEAYRMADPASARLADLQAAQAERLFEEAEGPLSPERRRMAEQQARAGSLARGRLGDESGVAAEILGREQFRAGLRQEARQAGQLGFGQSRALAGDIGSVLLGRPSQALGLGQNVLGQAQGQAAGPMGPQLFDPNVGINLALQQRGQDIEFQGMQAQASGAAIGGLFGGLGTLLGSGFGSPGGTTVT